MTIVNWAKAQRWMVMGALMLLVSLGVPWGCAGAGARKTAPPDAPAATVKERTSISQYGITWTFAQPVKSGQFVNGDWWVVGPVTVVSVSPKPTTGPLPGEVTMKDAVREEVKDVKGDMHFILGFIPPEFDKFGKDPRMRNGSEVVVDDNPHQGFDSRTNSYDPKSSISYPYQLAPNRTLISTISLAVPVGKGFAHEIMWRTEKQQRTLLRAAAVLTCLPTAPPADAFRPPYAGTNKPIYEMKDLQWQLLLNLKLKDMDNYFRQPWLNPKDPTCETATWADFESYFQRPWLIGYSAKDFDISLYYMQPIENQPNSASACDGREDSRLLSIATLMVHLDVPREQKRKLLIGLVQRGIDLSGYCKVGDAGRCTLLQSGCKWPILFASLMLDRPELRQFAKPIPFYEDAATYYGTGWFGQTALWRIVWHDHLIDSCEERAPEQNTGNDGISEHYRSYGSSGKAWLGTALSVRLMKAIKIWNHDAFFDYCDRWMDESPSLTQNRGIHKRPVWETETYEPFVTAMWKTYRKSAPAQEMAGNNVKAAWNHEKDGWHIQWVANPKPSAAQVAAHLEAIHKAFPKSYPETTAATP